MPFALCQSCKLTLAHSLFPPSELNRRPSSLARCDKCVTKEEGGHRGVKIDFGASVASKDTTLFSSPRSSTPSVRERFSIRGRHRKSSSSTSEVLARNFKSAVPATSKVSHLVSTEDEKEDHNLFSWAASQQDKELMDRVSFRVVPSAFWGNLGVIHSSTPQHLLCVCVFLLSG